MVIITITIIGIRDLISSDMGIIIATEEIHGAKAHTILRKKEFTIIGEETVGVVVEDFLLLVAEVGEV